LNFDCLSSVSLQVYIHNNVTYLYLTTYLTGGIKKMTCRGLTISLFSLLIPLVLANDEGNIFYLKSEPVCGNLMCREADYFHYYNCKKGECDFHLQPWLSGVIAFVVIVFLLSLVCSLISCICCNDKRR